VVRDRSIPALALGQDRRVLPRIYGLVRAVNVMAKTSPAAQRNSRDFFFFSSEKDGGKGKDEQGDSQLFDNYHTLLSF